MTKMFSRCGSLESFPDISKWDTKNVTEMDGMFKYCCKEIVPKKYKSLFE